MNLTEALNVALPEIPLHTRPKSKPNLHPNLVWRQHMQEGEATVICIVPGGDLAFRFSELQWALVQLCDGERSCEQLSEAALEQLGVSFPPEEIETYCNELDELGFWYKSPQEKTFLLNEKLQAERRKHVRRKSKVGDLSMIYVAWWDPDAYLTWLRPKLEFLFSLWFTIVALCAFAFMGYVFFQGRAEIWRDTLSFYNFTEKSGADLLEFWVLFCVLGFFHETAHGLTCKHFGGAVHKMGFLLIYLSPAFFVEVTEVYVYGGKWQRIATSIAGIYTELIICWFATVVWWGTTTGTFAHEFAYKIMLITGIAVVVMNLNPLMKLDGYYIFSELVGILNLKERSTAFVSTWTRRHILGLPVEVEYVLSRQRKLFAVYSVLSGLYSYTVLFVLVRITYNIGKHYSSDWAFVPALLVAYLVFRSRIRNVGRLMKTVYLDKREHVRNWLTAPRLAAITFALVAVLFAPVWRQSISGRFILGPANRVALHAPVNGAVVRVYADEGQAVQAGAPIVQLRDLKLESEAAQAAAASSAASARSTQAQLRYADYGTAERERQQLAERSRLLSEQVSKLSVVSPINGTVLTPRMRDLTGAYLLAGSDVGEVADLSTMRARIYIPEFAVHKLAVGAPSRVKPDGMFSARLGTVVSVAPASTEVADGLAQKINLKGMKPPQYYVAEILVRNPDGMLRDGMPGDAKIRVGRRSLAGFGWEIIRDFTGRKFW